VATKENRLCDHASHIYESSYDPRTKGNLQGGNSIVLCVSANTFSVPGPGSAGTMRRCSSNYGSRVDLRPPTLAVRALLATSGFLHRCTTAIPSAHPPLAISIRNARTQIFAPAPTVLAATMDGANESRIEGLGAKLRGVATAVLEILVSACCITPLTTPRRLS